MREETQTPEAARATQGVCMGPVDRCRDGDASPNSLLFAEVRVDIVEQILGLALLDRVLGG